MSNKMILDLGCGFAKVSGAIGVERAMLEGVDVVADLDSLPYPFADNSFDEIHLNDVIEHLPNVIKTMEEIYRIVKPNGHVFIRVIDWSSSMNADDPQHVRAFTKNTFNYFGTYKARSYYSTARFNVESVQTTYNPGVKKFIPFSRILKVMSIFLNNIIDGLYFDLKAIKPEPSVSATKVSAGTVDILRCPWCVEHRRTYAITDRPLRKMNEHWLVCGESSCHRKYPIYHNIPILNNVERDRWITTPLTDLPIPPPTDYTLIQKD